MKRFAPLLSLAALAAQPAFAAEPWTGAFWNEQCAPGASGEASLGCSAFVMGAIDGMRVQSMATKTPLPFCAPGNVSTGRTVELFQQRLASRPQDHGLPAVVILVNALGEAFPCKP
ncbi:Rap1a/Tai family immunity protein [Pigmentiphaga sp.]|uniref:Rap1a/Tai family immunity protein n=1 Tax=Pigmentiphaga sp. TaxID=1977564 RepID=UPI00128CF593|nr:Rap1a/Tai family immunity protein [Pigmentiphaga sp.]MPS28793.1 hypothetical protein [Alcaligenaceae bacterium SAGV5]MPS52562.1 hypothetical protein [Alcaligenaceae bacterium SAGV3]MPT60355.1 hypothetical protein [Alcaligenaceae bacterium]